METGFVIEMVEHTDKKRQIELPRSTKLIAGEIGLDKVAPLTKPFPAESDVVRIDIVPLIAGKGGKELQCIASSTAEIENSRRRLDLVPVLNQMVGERIICSKGPEEPVDPAKLEHSPDDLD